jgi:hypothetical protein
MSWWVNLSDFDNGVPWCTKSGGPFFGTPTGFFDTVILSSHSFGVILSGSQYIAVEWKIHRKQVVHYPCCIPRFAWEWLLFWSNYIFSRKYLDVF